MPADGIALVSLQRAIDEAVASLAAMIIYARSKQVVAPCKNFQLLRQCKISLLQVEVSS
jgi:hypothetical protein